MFCLFPFVSLVIYISVYIIIITNYLLPICTERHLHPKKTKLGAKHPTTIERHHLKFLLVQLCHPLVATTKHYLYLLLFTC